jgi:hypothetical protein
MSDSFNAFHFPVSEMEPTTFLFTLASKDREVIRIDGEGRIFWNSKEVFTDEEFRCMMKEMAQILINSRNDRSDIISC